MHTCLRAVTIALSLLFMGKFQEEEAHLEVSKVIKPIWVSGMSELSCSKVYLTANRWYRTISCKSITWIPWYHVLSQSEFAAPPPPPTSGVSNIQLSSHLPQHVGILPLKTKQVLDNRFNDLFSAASACTHAEEEKGFLPCGGGRGEGGGKFPLLHWRNKLHACMQISVNNELSKCLHV